MANRQEIVCNYIDSNYVQFRRLRRDVISNKIQVNTQRDYVQGAEEWRDITTADINDIVCDCSAESGLQITSREVLAVLQSHRIPDVHPLREYVNNCRPYTDDQPDWIAWLAEQVKVSGDEKEQQLWIRTFRKWFVAMVASWMRDEIVNQQVLVLIGKQGIFKTTWLEHLLPPELRAYSCKMANSTQLNKDERLRIAEYGLIALDEIDAMSAKELNVMKSVITASDISERAAYGYNRYAHSAIRQWLNSDAEKGGWWKQKNPFDHRPDQLATAQGFMAGLPQDFLQIVQPILVTTALNTTSDSELGASETTVDRFFLPSLEQEFIVPQARGVEGAYWEYWKERLELDSPQAQGAGGTNPAHIRYAYENHTSAQYVRLRSAYRATAFYAWLVYPSGYAGSTSATTALSAAERAR